MPGLDVPVSLAEVLYVRGAPLREAEAWGVLHSSAELLQELFFKGMLSIYL